MEIPCHLENYWPENTTKNILFLQNQVKVDLLTCVLWQNTKDWVLLPKNRLAPDFFILMPIKGRVLVKTKLSDDYIENGRFLILQPNTEHTLMADPSYGELHQISLHCHLSDPLFTPISLNDLSEIQTIQNTEFLVNKWLDLVYQINTDFGWGLKTGETFIKLLMEEVLKNNPNFIFHSVAIDERMKRAVAFIHTNYHKDISIEEIAAEISLKPVHFRNCFHEALGVTPKIYLINLRMKYACDLLKNRNYSIKEIANRVGFSQHDYFHKCFKEHFKTTPNEFRQNKSLYF
jgi:AraC-like DNA-binding protein